MKTEGDDGSTSATYMDEQLLTAAVLTQPDEDTPRLALVDELLANGEQNRGQFIRMQVEGARAGETGAAYPWAGAGSPPVLRELVVEQPWRDLGFLARVCSHRGFLVRRTRRSAVLWRRGFIEGVVCPGVNLAPALHTLRLHPVREVVLTSEPTQAGWRQLDPNWNDPRRIAYALAISEANAILTATLRLVFTYLLTARFGVLDPEPSRCPFSIVHPEYQLLRSELLLLEHELFNLASTDP